MKPSPEQLARQVEACRAGLVRCEANRDVFGHTDIYGSAKHVRAELRRLQSRLRKLESEALP